MLGSLVELTTSFLEKKMDICTSLPPLTACSTRSTEDQSGQGSCLILVYVSSSKTLMNLISNC